MLPPDSIPFCIIENGNIVTANAEFKKILEETDISVIMSHLRGRDNTITVSIKTKVYKIYIKKDTNKYTLLMFDQTAYPNIVYKNKDSIQTFILENEYLSHIKTIDEQHSNLVTVVNTIIQALLNNLPLEDIVYPLYKLYRDTVFHFKVEEKLVAEYSLEEVEHIQDHKKLITELELLISNLTIDNLIATIAYLKVWLLDHIKIYDLPLGEKLLIAGYNN